MNVTCINGHGDQVNCTHIPVDYMCTSVGITWGVMCCAYFGIFTLYIMNRCKKNAKELCVEEEEENNTIDVQVQTDDVATYNLVIQPDNTIYVGSDPHTQRRDY